MRFLAIFVTALILTPQTFADEPKPSETQEMVGQIQQQLLKEFDDMLADPKAYEKRVQAARNMFPEGDLFPYVFPVFAYTNLALKDTTQKQHARAQLEKLIPFAIESAVKRVKPQGDDLKNLGTYQEQAVYLGQLNSAFGCYRLVGGDGRFDALQKKLSDVLHEALVKADGHPLKSYPYLAWPFDTMPCLVSLKLYDQQTGKPRSDEAIRKHLDWIEANGTDKMLGLPRHWMANDGTIEGAPRGCDLSWRIFLMQNLDPARAKKLYKNYTQAYWLDRSGLTGFAEYPHGEEGGADVDSGPIFMGLGMAASGLGVGTTLAMGDEERTQKLCGQISGIKSLISLLQKAGQRIQIIPKSDSSYVTGFLYGDVSLFYAVTWQQWIVQKEK